MYGYTHINHNIMYSHLKKNFYPHFVDNMCITLCKQCVYIFFTVKNSLFFLDFLCEELFPHYPQNFFNDVYNFNFHVYKPVNSKI